MKNYWIPFLFILSLLASCSLGTIETPSATSVYSVTKSVGQLNEYAVSIEDFYMLVGGESSVVDLICYPDNNSPLLIAANYQDGGYVVVSGDKRADPIVAFSKTEKIELTEETKWIFEEYALPIESIAKTDEVSDLMKQNLRTWERIRENVFGASGVQTKVAGQYRYVIRTTILERDSYLVNPLLETRWGQGNKNGNDYYWNYYCPWSYSSCIGTKCPAGCVAVAGGQLAYYLRNREGVSIKMPVTASVSGYASNYQQSFSSLLTTSFINNMPLDYSCEDGDAIEHARIFLAFIGDQISMDYTPFESRAATSNLVDLFYGWGINSVFHGQQSFDEDEIWNSIGNNTPVVVHGFRGNSSGHAWVIDGRKDAINIHITYYYVTDELLTEEQIEQLTMRDCNDYADEIVSTGKYFHMNLGWNGSSDGWYSSNNWTIGNRAYTDHKAALIIL